MKAFNKALLPLALAIGVTFAADSHADKAGDWTIHTVSAHVGVSGLNNVNPGVGYNVTDGLRVGALYNSYKKPSAYVAGFIDFPPGQNRVRVGGGLISGYTFDTSDTADSLITGKTTGIVPLVAVEVDITKNVSVVWFGQAFNLEVKF